MTYGRLIVQGCTGFDRKDSKPEPTLLYVLGLHHYRVWCADPEGNFLYIPIRDFEVLDFPKNDETPLDPSPQSD